MLTTRYADRDEIQPQPRPRTGESTAAVVVARDGTSIFYQCLQPRPSMQERSRTILLIGPLGLDGRLWRLAAPLATERGYTVIAVDNRGCGRSGVPHRPWSVRTMAADAIAVLDDAGVRRAHLCGPSFGGMIAQEIAISYPERVGALVLPSTTPGLPRLDLLPWRSILATLISPARRVRARGSREDAVRRALRMLLSEPAAEATVPRDPLWGLVEELIADPPPLRGRLLQLVAGPTHMAWHRLGRIRAPTQIQHGTADRVVPPRAASTLARRIPNSRLLLFEGAGHALILERPEQAGGAALDFLIEHDGLLREPCSDDRSSGGAFA